MAVISAWANNNKDPVEKTTTSMAVNKVSEGGVQILQINQLRYTGRVRVL